MSEILNNDNDISKSRYYMQNRETIHEVRPSEMSTITKQNILRETQIISMTDDADA